VALFKDDVASGGDLAATGATQLGYIPDAITQAWLSDRSNGANQLDWARAAYLQNLGVTGDVVDNFLQSSSIGQNLANVAAERYENVFQPLEDELIEEARNYATPERRAQNMGAAEASVAQAMDAQRANAQRDLEAYGIDPSSTRYQALDLNSRIQEGAAEAGAGNQAGLQTDALARALRSEALNIGQRYPGNITAALAAGNQGLTGAANATLAQTASGANTMGTGMAWEGLANQGMLGLGGLINASNQNAINAARANQNQSSGLGGLLGAGAGLVRSFFADGGSVRTQPTEPPQAPPNTQMVPGGYDAAHPWRRMVRGQPNTAFYSRGPLGAGDASFGHGRIGSTGNPMYAGLRNFIGNLLSQNFRNLSGIPADTGAAAESTNTGAAAESTNTGAVSDQTTGLTSGGPWGLTGVWGPGSSNVTGTWHKKLQNFSSGGAVGPNSGWGIPLDENTALAGIPRRPPEYIMVNGRMIPQDRLLSARRGMNPRQMLETQRRARMRELYGPQNGGSGRPPINPSLNSRGMMWDSSRPYRIGNQLFAGGGPVQKMGDSMGGIAGGGIDMSDDVMGTAGISQQSAPGATNAMFGGLGGATLNLAGAGQQMPDNGEQGFDEALQPPPPPPPPPPPQQVGPNPQWGLPGGGIGGGTSVSGGGGGGLGWRRAGLGGGWAPGRGRAQMFAAGGTVTSTPGGMVPQQMSPSGGGIMDDVPAMLTAEEFVIPRDVAVFKGHEFFQRMIDKTRSDQVKQQPQQAPQQPPQQPRQMVAPRGQPPMFTSRPQDGALPLR
jgi:hypothetical protein